MDEFHSNYARKNYLPSKELFRTNEMDTCPFPTSELGGKTARLHQIKEEFRDAGSLTVKEKEELKELSVCFFFFKKDCMFITFLLMVLFFEKTNQVYLFLTTFLTLNHQCSGSRFWRCGDVTRRKWTWLGRSLPNIPCFKR